MPVVELKTRMSSRELSEWMAYLMLQSEWREHPPAQQNTVEGDAAFDLFSKAAKRKRGR